MILNMSALHISRPKIASIILGVICAMMIAFLNPAVVSAQSSKPAPKGTPPRVIVPKSDREKPKEPENKDERPKRP